MWILFPCHRNLSCPLFTSDICFFAMSDSGGYPITVNCVLLTAGSRLPSMGSAFSIGYDLYPSRPVTLGGYERALVPTGLCIEVPLGFCGLVCPRSSLVLYSNVSMPSYYLDADAR